MNVMKTGLLVCVTSIAFGFTGATGRESSFVVIEPGKETTLRLRFPE